MFLNQIQKGGDSDDSKQQEWLKMNEHDRNGSKRNREFGLDGVKIDAQSKLIVILTACKTRGGQIQLLMFSVSLFF